MNSEVVSLAARLADRAHHGQFRRDGVTPYVRHPEAVAARVAGDLLAEAVAWLHDTIEDTEFSAARLREEGVPEEVIARVLLLTKSVDTDYERYLAAVKADPVARKVKVADMLANLADNPSERQILKYARGLTLLLS